MKTTLDIDVTFKTEPCLVIGIAPWNKQNICLKLETKQGMKYYIVRKDLLAKVYATMVEYEENTKEARR